MTWATCPGASAASCSWRPGPRRAACRGRGRRLAQSSRANKKGFLKERLAKQKEQNTLDLLSRLSPNREGRVPPPQKESSHTTRGRQDGLPVLGERRFSPWGISLRPGASAPPGFSVLRAQRACCGSHISRLRRPRFAAAGR